MTACVVNLALVQMACDQDKQANIAKAVQSIDHAAKLGANVVCLQEVFNTRYPCQSEEHINFGLAETIPGPTSEVLQNAALRNGVVVTCSIFERRAPGLYHNTAITFDADGEQVGLYRKMHIPDDPLYYEKFYFTPGDLGFSIAETKFGKLGIGVCWDQWYPEAARLFALRGAEILIYPTAIGWIHAEREEYGTTQHASWETAMRAHAIANGVYVAAVNRVGTEDGLQFWGASFVADPNGVVLQRASHHVEEMLIVPCDLGRIDTVRTHWPFLRDRRVDAYQGITQRFLDM
ncbi:MAG: carbon-nitrogen hydrolase [Planctomycetales bacterium]|nr:carbon-nitrogen hydrolase [Planctomycetales bacterium]